MQAQTVTSAPDFDSPPPVGTSEHALWLVQWHFEFETPDRLHKLADLYHDDIVWEVPTRRVVYRGKDDVLANYARLFDSMDDATMDPIERYATPDRVFDDLEVTFTLTNSKGFPNHPLPVGTRVAMRMVHNFHIKDGLILRENGYEMWRPVSWR